MSYGAGNHRRLDEGYFLEITPTVADTWGTLQAIRPLPDIDALIAATALDRDLTLATRNTADFVGLGLRLANPFEAAP